MAVASCSPACPRKSIPDANSDDGVVPEIKAPEEIISDQPNPISQIEAFLGTNSEELIPENLHDNTEYLRWKVRFVVESLPFRIFILICILVDLAIVITDIATSSQTFFMNETDSTNTPYTNPDTPYEEVDLAFSSLLLLELVLRIFALEFREFFIDRKNIFDVTVILGTWILSILNVVFSAESLTDKLKILYILRIIRIIRIIRILRLFLLATEKQHLEVGVRHLVSGNKRRYQKDGFDLDLTYVTDRVIAMSFPSTGRKSFYRNPMKDVVRFLDTKHPNCYKVYNLCSEEGYDPQHFHGRVERFYIDDHNVPSIHQMVDFTRSVKHWLESDPKNVVAVHCKGGKGRTGTMICTWLVEAGFFRKAEDSLNYYGTRRTDWRAGRTFQGVETPSQSRYVGYYEEIKCNQGLLPAKRFVRWRIIRFEPISRFGKGDGSDLTVEIFNTVDKKPFFRAELGTGLNCIRTIKTDIDAVECYLFNCPLFEGDVKILVRCRTWSVPRGAEGAAFYFWFNTSFVKDHKWRLKKEELDNLHKGGGHSYFPDHFAVELDFDG